MWLKETSATLQGEIPWFNSSFSGKGMNIPFPLNLKTNFSKEQYTSCGYLLAAWWKCGGPLVWLQCCEYMVGAYAWERCHRTCKTQCCAPCLQSTATQQGNLWEMCRYVQVHQTHLHLFRFAHMSEFCFEATFSRSSEPCRGEGRTPSREREREGEREREIHRFVGGWIHGMVFVPNIVGFAVESNAFHMECFFTTHAWGIQTQFQREREREREAERQVDS